MHTKWSLAETSRQVHLPRKRDLINRDRHQHATSRSMDSHLLAIGYMKSYLTDKIKRSFFQAAVVSILLYGCTTWTLTKWMEKKLNGNYTRMLRAILNKSSRQHPTKQQLYGHLPPIKKTIQVRRTRHAGHCWRSGDELIRDVLLWTPSHGRAKAGWPAKTYMQQLCIDTGCIPEDLLEAMEDREGWRKKVRDIRADGVTWWGWWWWLISWNHITVCKQMTALAKVMMLKLLFDNIQMKCMKMPAGNKFPIIHVVMLPII